MALSTQLLTNVTPTGNVAEWAQMRRIRNARYSFHAGLDRQPNQVWVNAIFSVAILSASAPTDAKQRRALARSAFASLCRPSFAIN